MPTKSSTITVPREPACQKDKEPVLSNYVKIPQQREFSYQPLTKLEPKSSQCQLNNLRLYKLIQTPQ